jgi:hypothetical protein
VIDPEAVAAPAAVYLRVPRLLGHAGIIANHCKPCRDCDTNEERLNGENGLLLTPSIDHLFDRGFIGFEGHRWNGWGLSEMPASHGSVPTGF